MKKQRNLNEMIHNEEKRVIRILILLFITLLLLQGCKNAKGTISVKVVDQQGTPVKDVSVELKSSHIPGNIKKLTSANGTCRFTSLADGDDYILTLRKPGFKPKWKKNINVSKSKKRNIRLMLIVNHKTVPGRWRVARSGSDSGALKSRQIESMRKLESLGYLSGHKKAPYKKNVTIYDRNRAFDGLNLYCSGHGPEALLIDMNGKQLHRWYYEFPQIWEQEYGSWDNRHQFWRHVQLLENGDLLAIFEDYGIIKLDRDSNLIWSYQGKAHHDLFIMPDKRIFTLTKEAVIDPKYNENEPILKDFIAELSPEGKEIRRVSVLGCLENSKYSSILGKMRKKGDILHTNAIEVLDGKLAARSPAFKRGNILISIRNLDLICVVDLQKESVVWVMSGLWRRQHLPTVLANGNMLIFDNKYGKKPVSRVLEFDPLTGRIFWEYRGTQEHPFYTADCGTCQRLANGNTLICESNSGRAFEVTPDKTTVWEFFNPHRAGENNELIATLAEMVRIPPGYKLDWLNTGAAVK